MLFLPRAAAHGLDLSFVTHIFLLEVRVRVRGARCRLRVSVRVCRVRARICPSSCAYTSLPRLEPILDPELLEQISQLREEYLAAHPQIVDRPEAAIVPPVPTRVQPARDREQPQRLILYAPAVENVTDDALVNAGLRELRRRSATRRSVLQLLTTEFTEYVDFESAVAASAA